MNLIFYLVGKFLDYFLKKMKLFIIYRDGAAIGDQLCISAIVYEIHKQLGMKCLVISKYPDLFLNNPDVVNTVALDRIPRIVMRVITFFVRTSKIKYIGNFNFYRKKMRFQVYMNKVGSYRKLHLLQAHTLDFKIDLNLLHNVYPKIYFSKDETLDFEKELNLDFEYITVHSTTKESFTPNKSWSFDKLQETINLIHGGGIKIIQVGLASDPELKNTIDMRGKTENLRKLCFIISKSRLVLTTEGLLNHVAAAFGIMTVVVQSGFSHPELAKYQNNWIIYHRPKIGCAPCWLTSPCPHPTKICTENISPFKVSELVLDLINNKNNCDSSQFIEI